MGLTEMSCSTKLSIAKDEAMVLVHFGFLD